LDKSGSDSKDEVHNQIKSGIRYFNEKWILHLIDRSIKYADIYITLKNATKVAQVNE